MSVPPAASGATESPTGRELERLRALLTACSGVSLSEEHEARLSRAMTSGMKRLALDTVRAYLEAIERDTGPDGELHRLVDELSNHETYFFREEHQLEAFAEEILPELCKGTRRRLNLWSAGCASGEEPLTLGMLLMDSPLWEESLGRMEVRILGTDISRSMIRRARKACYGASSWKGLEARRCRDLQHRFFERQGEGFRPIQALRQLVSYLQINLLDRDGMSVLGDMDVILCRNVLMYFPPEERMRAIQSFYRKLPPRGFLLLGHSENLFGLETPFEAQRLRGALLYRKPARPPEDLGPEWSG